MTVESLFRRLIREVLAEPVAGQKYKSTPRMPVTMASGKSIEITNVSGPEEDKVITFTVDDGSGKIYTIQRRWSDVVNGGGEWFTESKKNSKKKKTIEVGSTKTKRCKNCEKPHLENKKCECGVK